MTTPLHVVIGPGILGQTIATQLCTQGARVRLVSRSGRTAGVAGVETVAADVMVPEQAVRACEGAAVIYQCGAPAYQNWQKEFPVFQDNIIRGAARAGAVLVAAENLYGYGIAGTLTEDLPLTATTRKGRTRALMTRRLFEAHAKGDLRAVAGRAADFLGPNVHVSAMGERLWPRLLDGKPVDWFGNPDVVHSLTYVPDFARALIRLGQEDRMWGRAWHVPSPAPRTPRDVIGQAAAMVGLAAPRIRILPKWLLRGVGMFNPAAGELVEMAYSFDAPFVMDDSAYRGATGETATGWDTALVATLGSWTKGTVRATAA